MSKAAIIGGICMILWGIMGLKEHLRLNADDDTPFLPPDGGKRIRDHNDFQDSKRIFHVLAIIGGIIVVIGGISGGFETE